MALTSTPVSLNAASAVLEIGPKLSAKKEGPSFSSVLESCRNRSALESLTGDSLHKELLHFKEQILSGKTFSPKELLVYQIRASEFNLRVELLAKIADALLATTRKLQSGQ